MSVSLTKICNCSGQIKLTKFYLTINSKPADKGHMLDRSIFKPLILKCTFNKKCL